jgi:RNA polymerase sigma-70 factor (ECF subfamily)
MERDEELLRAWAAGDAAAGRALFERHFEPVLRFFRNKCGGEDGELEDLVQATFAQCLASHASFRGEASFRTYLFTIARNELYAHWRRRQRSRAELDVTSMSVEDLRTSPRSKLAAHQDRQLLARALREIPLELQVALELHYWEDLSGPELAAILDIPEGTVRSRLRRGRELLQADRKSTRLNSSHRLTSRMPSSA